MKLSCAFWPNKVREASGAKMVLVFGSVARGESGPESDLDLLPVLDDDANLLEAALEGRMVLSEGRYAVDIVPIRERSFNTTQRLNDAHKT